MLRPTLIALFIATLLAASPETHADEFSSGSNGGATTRQGCPDPRNEKYSQSFGVQALFLPIEVAKELYGRDPHVFYRCASDICHENSLVCWPRKGATADFPELLRYGGVLEGYVSNQPDAPDGESGGGGGNPGGTTPDPPGTGTGLPGGTGPAPGGLPTDPAAGPPPSAVLWVNGAFRGFAACAAGAVQSLGDILAAAALIERGDFEAAEQALGLERGQGQILRTIVAEANATTVNATPDQAGERVARRICQALLLRVGNLAKGRLKGAPVSAAELNASWRDLQGKWVDIDGGPPLKLGRRLGLGRYGAVYENASVPGTTVKVFKPQSDLAAGMKRDLEGYKNIPADIPRREILSVQYPGAGKAGVFLMKEVTRSFPNERVQLFSQHITNLEQSQAVKSVYESLADQGLIAADLSPGNLFGLRNHAGQWRVGILDSDMIFHAKDFAAQPPGLQSHLRDLLSLNGTQHLLNTANIDASAVMRALYDVRAFYKEFRAH